MSETFRLSRQVEFNHCDPAGMVFYPRYFEMISATIERFLSDAIGYGWSSMGVAEKGMGTPMGQIEVRFANPSYLGEWLDLDLTLARLGTASATFDIRCSSKDEARFDCRTTIIHAHTGGGKSAPWPPEARARMVAFQPPATAQQKESDV
ncbi:acyl-CoA thioesterase [Sedimentitalea todarodis]|uniref:Thioesterase family protein n=1 Tax=Sedimentitalea todarodis TaxID=1631240 RepID=A0ABU3VDQ8_9RHOB|nr:thioesterase family protein [Sedimentitalea todarodis]MDU9004308.1 thioesterase family protein [Sedimentitalea todarodis]